MNRGALIVFEGCDRCGKSTQTRLLFERIQCESTPSNETCGSADAAVLMQFPNRQTAVGKMLDAYLKSHTEMHDKTVHLLFSANRWESADAISNALLAGSTVVVDRYAYSGVAFSSAKGLPLAWCKNPDRGLIKPDVVIFLDAPMDKLLSRGQFGEERYEKVEFQRKVEKQFTQLMDPHWRIINADQPVEAVHEEIWRIFKEVQFVARSKPLGLLWTQDGSKVDDSE